MLVWAALGTFACDLVWEIAKANLDPGVRSHWPWRLEVLDRQTCATVVGTLAAALVARTQLSQSVRPLIGWSATGEPASILAQNTRLIRLQNYGGGRAVVQKISYSMQPAPDAGTTPTEWLGWADMVAHMSSFGLENHRDYTLVHLGAGAVLPAMDASWPGLELFAVTENCRTQLHRFDCRIRVADILGDEHERRLAFVRIRHDPHE